MVGDHPDVRTSGSVNKRWMRLCPTWNWAKHIKLHVGEIIFTLFYFLVKTKGKLGHFLKTQTGHDENVNSTRSLVGKRTWC